MTVRRTDWQDLWLRVFEADGLARACEAAGVPNSTVYNERDRNPDFAARWRRARERRDRTRGGANAALIEFARTLGLSLAKKNAWELRSRLGEEGAREWLREVHAVIVGAQAVGVVLTKREAVGHLMSAGGSAAAIDKLARRRETHLGRSLHACRLAGPLPRDRQARTNALAGCHCRRCLPGLVATTRAYARAVARDHAPWDMDPEDVEAETLEPLLVAVDTWDGVGSFAVHYGWKIEKHFAVIAKRERARRRRAAVASLDAPLRITRTGKSVTLADTIPDRTLDTAEIVIIRDRLWRRIEREIARRERARRSFRRRTRGGSSPEGIAA